jgi:DNA repair protein SbcD/Mre11
MFKFIHAADIHLDSPLRGLSFYEGAPVEEIRLAPRRALVNLIDLAIEEKVAFVLISGDLYDGDWRDFNTGYFFVRQAARLREANIPLFLIAGNHDAASKITKELPLPENTTFFSSIQPESRILDHYEVAIHGQSFAKAAVMEDLSLAYPKADLSLFNIGMLHTSAGGSGAHERYAPCTLDGLKSKGYDYWALGHIHLRETLCEKPYVAFSGNVQGRHAKETGPKGCLLVTVDDSRACSVEFRELDVLRWDSLLIDVTDELSSESILDKVKNAFAHALEQAPDKPHAIRLELHGRTPIHAKLLSQKTQLTHEIRALGIDIGQGKTWIEKVKFSTSAILSRDDSESMDGAMQEIESLFAQLRDSGTEAILKQLDLDDLTKKLPIELQSIGNMQDCASLNAIMNEAEATLLQKLLSDEADQ